MSSATVDPITPPRVDDDKRVQRHRRQREELVQKLECAQARRSELLAERDQRRRDRHEAEVAALLGGGDAALDNTAARLEQLDGEIESAAAHEAAVVDALSMHDVIAEGVRTQVETEIREQVREAMAALYQEAIPLLEQLHALNKQLFTLAGSVTPSLETLPLPPGLPAVWLEQARQRGRG